MVQRVRKKACVVIIAVIFDLSLLFAEGFTLILRECHLEIFIQTVHSFKSLKNGIWRIFYLFKVNILLNYLHNLLNLILCVLLMIKVKTLDLGKRDKHRLLSYQPQIIGTHTTNCAKL